MIEQTIVELLVRESIATNQWQAKNIYNGLMLGELDTEEACLERAKLYREWRSSQVYPRDDTKSCYKEAISGNFPPQLVFQQTLKTPKRVDEGEELAEWLSNADDQLDDESEEG